MYPSLEKGEVLLLLPHTPNSQDGRLHQNVQLYTVRTCPVAVSARGFVALDKFGLTDREPCFLQMSILALVTSHGDQHVEEAQVRGGRRLLRRAQRGTIRDASAVDAGWALIIYRPSCYGTVLLCRSQS